MNSFACPGLPANWINAWLAAVGITVLDSRIRLSWTDDRAAGAVPRAVLSTNDADPIELLAEAWPTRECLEGLPLAEEWEGAKERSDTGTIKFRVPIDEFRKRARAARGNPFSWTLSSTLTDLLVDKDGYVAHAPFDPSVPGGVSLHRRLIDIHKLVQSPTVKRLRLSLKGQGERVQNNGLAFDLTRLASLADATDPRIEPVIETLAFFGLALLPLRASGVDATRGGSKRARERQRGWLLPKSTDTDSRRRFFWSTWTEPLDIFGIDALLDIWQPGDSGATNKANAHIGWRTVRYKPRASGDPTRGFGAERCL